MPKCSKCGRETKPPFTICYSCNDKNKSKKFKKFGSKKCPKCGTVISRDQKYCGSCNRKSYK